VLLERKTILMKFKDVLLACLVSIGLLTIGAGGYFSAGNPGGLRAASSYRLAPTPANQAWERNNAWANYTGQNRQVQVPNVSTGTSGSALQHNVVTP
jgi:hypothetical protein